MKRGASELILEKFLRSSEMLHDTQNLMSSKQDKADAALLGVQVKDNNFQDFCCGGGGGGGGGGDDLSFNFIDQDTLNGFSNCGGMTEGLVWSENLSPWHSSTLAGIDSQPSIYGHAYGGFTFGCGPDGSSTMMGHKPKSVDNQAHGGASSDPSGEQSDEEDLEMEGGTCEQSMDTLDSKRRKRMEQNRISAIRSRRRKKAQLCDLELKVDQLKGRKETLKNQLRNAEQQHDEASINYKALKLIVKALRTKVELAKNMVAEGSLTRTLNLLLQTHTTTTGSTQPLNSHNLCHVSTVSPTMGVQANDISHVGMSMNRPIAAFGLESGDDIHNSIINNKLNCSQPSLQKIASLELLQNEAVSYLSEIWPYESPVPPISRQS